MCETSIFLILNYWVMSYPWNKEL